MLNIENVSKIFEEKNSHQVLENISMTMKEGEFACVLGPSGCGKSVFLYLLAGFLKPTQGKILLDEKPIEKPTTERILIFQD
ncbi:MAG: ABC transporter related protein [Parcubacteria group bacterium GW2011_GWC1_43_12]|nr:MAG: ABC transporter related protein [Parcubacteria group bacterium GW2011_GWC1_43_12]